MPMSKVISELESAMEATRAELREINQQINTLENERTALTKRPPHTDDIVAVFSLGLANAGASFEQELRSALNADFVLAENAATVWAKPATGARNILRLDSKKLSLAEAHDRAIKRELPPLNMNALAYFLREAIAAEMPALVERLCPAARGGIKSADRAQALAELDGKLAALRSNRDGLVHELETARAIVTR